MKRNILVVSFLTTLMTTCVLASAVRSPTASAAQQGTVTKKGEYSKETREYHLKAAFLRYVAQFVEWPEKAIPSDNINMCVYGLVPSFEALSSINGKVANKRKINLSRVSDLQNIKGQCQVLYTMQTREDQVPSIIKDFEEAPVLTFGDMEGFAEKGGDMNFYIANNRLAIMINPPAVKKSQLKISPRMLRLVTVIPSAAQTTFDD